MKKSLLALTLIALSGPVIAQEQSVRVMPDDFVWKDNTALPKGSKFALLLGNPSKAGDVIVLRLKYPPNYQVPPHTHPYAEVVTVLSGNIGSSRGDKFAKNSALMPPGAMWVYPKGQAHYSWTEGDEAIVQVQYVAPGGIDYIDPADDPRKK